ncbi:unnamed protein product [Mytilus coruscus]|uniref:Ig-like domain-containing protein n=1 Tax=Mytilus coruscus TaxID=42192 RepID=A0A6J8DMK6_MYTCO|nr:unnamed protein product [Mytilus coruscus]
MDTTLLMLMVLICMQSSTACTQQSSKIYWKEIDYPIILGRNVTLFCNTSAVGTRKTTWMKESDVILHQGLSFYPDKYTGKEVTDGSTLTIVDTTITDFNISYTCLSDVHSYDNVLTINTTNFISIPQYTDTIWTILDQQVFVQINLTSVFPVPNCSVNINDIILLTIQQQSFHILDLFYHGTLNITSRTQEKICERNLTVVCDFGFSYSDVIATKVLQNCNVTNQMYNSYDFEHVWIIIGTFVSGFFLFIITTVCLGFICSSEKRGGHRHALCRKNICYMLCCHFLSHRCNKVCKMIGVFPEKYTATGRSEGSDSNSEFGRKRTERKRKQKSDEQTNNKRINLLTDQKEHAVIEIDVYN